MANDGDSHKIMFAENCRNKCAFSFRRNHGLRGSASPVLTATGFVSGRGQFLTPTESTPLDQSPKNLLLVIMSATLRLCQIWCKFVHGELLGKWVKYITKFCFHELTYRSDPSTDFHAWWLKRSGLAQGCAFWGFVNIAPYFGGEIFPKPHFWGRE